MIRLLSSTVVVSLLILILMLVKKTLFQQMSSQMHYKIWYFLFVPFLTSLIPWRLEIVENGVAYLKNVFASSKASTGAEMSTSPASHTAGNQLLHDFSVSVNKSTPDFLYPLLISIWLLGMVVFFIVTLYALYRVYQLRKLAITVKDANVRALFQQCKEAVGLKRHVALLESMEITSPITLGVFKPTILLPKQTSAFFSLEELKYVLLHELSHQKNRDVLVNYMLRIFHMAYWFNPLVWHALKKIRLDRELACDAAVLELLHDNGYAAYGHTIIHFADRTHDRVVHSFVSGIGGTKKQIKQRIRSIAAYTKTSQAMKWKNKAVGMVVGIFVLCLTPLTAVVAKPDTIYNFHEAHVKEADLSRYFAGYDGSFVLYDATQQQYQLYNRKQSTQRVSPDSTYKIYSALFALETQAISPSSNEKIWNGTKYAFDEWNRDQTVYSAMHDSVNWYFQTLDHQVGRKQLQAFFQKIAYGNANLSGGLDRYWMESSLKISPVEQVQLLTALNENKYGFDKQNLDVIKRAMLVDQQKNQALFGKTGTGIVNGKDINGWFIGFVTKADHRYYFAVNIQNKHGQANGSTAAKIAKRILHDQKIY